MAALTQALDAAGLPADDVEADDVELFAFRRGGRVVGYGGLEIHGDAALLRSIVVDPGVRNEGIGVGIVDRLIGFAASRGARRTFLLTTNATTYFARLGFVAVDRDDAPQAILATRQAAGLCPLSATLMARSAA